VRGRYGRQKVPDRFGAVFFGAIGAALVVLVIVRNPHRVGLTADFLPLLALCSFPLIAGVWWWHKATVYEREHAAYQRERARVQQKLATLSGP
jgi:hypothetical protein